MKKFLSPSTLAELKKILIQNKNRNIVFLGGGTDLLVQKDKYNKADIIIDLMKINKLSEISCKNESISIGSTAIMSDIINHEQLYSIFPLLVEAAKTVGSPQIRNRATIGGNLANASPAGDTLPALSVAKTKISIFKSKQEKVEKIANDKFFLGPGKTILSNGDYIISFEIQKKYLHDYEYSFHKVGQRKTLAISKLSLACLFKKSNRNIVDIRLAVGSVAPTVKRLLQTEKYLRKNNKNIDYRKLSDIVKSEVNPITDIRSTGEYRKVVTSKLVKKCVKQIFI